MVDFTETLPDKPLTVYLSKPGLPVMAIAEVAVTPLIFTIAPVSVTMFIPPTKSLDPTNSICGILST